MKGGYLHSELWLWLTTLQTEQPSNNKSWAQKPSLLKGVSFWEIKKQRKGLSLPPRKHLLWTPTYWMKDNQCLVCTTVWHYIRCWQHLFLSLFDKCKIQLFKFPFTLINMNNILYRLPKHSSLPGFSLHLNSRYVTLIQFLSLIFAVCFIYY